MKILNIAKQLLKRDWRSGELRVIALSVFIAVASLTSVSFFTDRAYLAMQQQSSSLLGGDLLYSSSRPINPALLALAQKQQLQTAKAVLFPSMIFHQGQAILSSVKAITENFPLRGNFMLSRRAYGTVFSQQKGPNQSQVWVEQTVLQRLKLEVGDVLQLGKATLTISAIIQQEPGRGGEMFNIAPRVLLNEKDLISTGLVSESSRVSYQLMLAGSIERIKQFRQASRPLENQYMRISDSDNARPEITSALQRAEQFLGLAAICSLLIATVAIVVATRRYTLRHLNSCAIMRCLGASQKDIVGIFVVQMIMLGFIASVLGCILGYAAQELISGMLVSLVNIELPSATSVPWLLGMLVGVVTLLSFSLPSLLQLKNVPSLCVIRREMGKLKTPGLLSYGIGVILVALLILWQAKDVKIASYMIFGTSILVICLYILACLVLYCIKRLALISPFWWRISLLNMSRRRTSSIVQICALSIGIMVLILLTSFRQDFLRDWQNSLPEDAPNRFLVNIQPDQLGSLQTFMQQQGFSQADFYPMVKGRLMKINGEKIQIKNYNNPRTKHLLRREFNLSWAEQLPSHNEITAGQWWKPSAGQISIEQGIAKTIGINLGDRLLFRSGSQEVELTVTSFRKVDWMSFKVNFFAIVNPGHIDNFASSYITSFHLPDDRGAKLAQLVKQFPNITVIDIAAIMNHVRGIITKVVLAVQYVFGFALIAGLIVLYSTLVNSMDERSYEYALLRTLGANKQKIRLLIIFEFAVQGFIAALFAVAAAIGILYLIAQFGLNMEYSWPLWPWTYGVFGGGTGLVILAYMGLRKILHRAPMPVLLGN